MFKPKLSKVVSYLYMKYELQNNNSVSPQDVPSVIRNPAGMRRESLMLMGSQVFL